MLKLDSFQCAYWNQLRPDLRDLLREPYIQISPENVFCLEIQLQYYHLNCFYNFCPDFALNIANGLMKLASVFLHFVTFEIFLFDHAYTSSVNEHLCNQ